MRQSLKVGAALWLLTCGAGACLEDIEDSRPVKQLSSPDDTVELSRGEAQELVVQTVDVNGQPVNGAHVTFARSERDRVAFESVTDDVDAITIVTEERTSKGVSLSGTAVARVRAFFDAKLGDTSVVALVKDPTASPNAAVALRIAIRVEEARTGDAGTEAGSDGAQTDAVGNGTFDARDDMLAEEESK